jgi:hypothetical protein
MGDHIDFIEKVYDTIKSPMYYICDKVSGVKPLTEEERRQLE